MVCDGLFLVELYNCSTEKCVDVRKSSSGGSVVFVDIDEPFFILVKASIADYEDYICIFELNGCDLGFTLHCCCGSGEFLCGVPNKDGARLRSMCITSSTNPWEERLCCQSLLTVHFYDVDLVVPGHSQDQSAFRSELAGLYGLVTAVDAICQFYGI
jgi:hypothetical protein